MLRMKKKTVKRIVSLNLAAALLMSGSATAFAASLISDETRDKSVEIAHKIEAEGIVLLENENGVLPLKEKKVNVFGAAS